MRLGWDVEAHGLVRGNYIDGPDDDAGGLLGVDGEVLVAVDGLRWMFFSSCGLGLFVDVCMIWMEVVMCVGAC